MCALRARSTSEWFCSLFLSKIESLCLKEGVINLHDHKNGFFQPDSLSEASVADFCVRRCTHCLQESQLFRLTCCLDGVGGDKLEPFDFARRIGIDFLWRSGKYVAIQSIGSKWTDVIVCLRVRGLALLT